MLGSGSVEKRNRMGLKVTKSFYTSSDIWTQLEDIASAEGGSVSQVISRAIHEFLQKDFLRSSWDTLPEDNWYDERRFYTYSQDKRGHSVTARFAIPKNIAGHIKRIVDSGVIPELKSAADFYRNAIFHYSRKVGQWIDDGEVLTTLTWYVMYLEDETQMQARKDYDTFLETMKANLDEALLEKDYKHLETYLNQRASQSALIPEKHRQGYLDLIDAYRERLQLIEDGKVTYLENLTE